MVKGVVPADDQWFNITKCIYSSTVFKGAPKIWRRNSKSDFLFCIYNINEVMIQTQKDLFLSSLNKQAVLGGK